VYAQSVDVDGDDWRRVRIGEVERQETARRKRDVTWSTNTGCGTTAVTSGNPGVATCTTSISGWDLRDHGNVFGDSNHNGSSATLAGGQVVNQASQTITVTVPAPATATNKSSFTVVASASSGLAITFHQRGSVY